MLRFQPVFPLHCSFCTDWDSNTNCVKVDKEEQYQYQSLLSKAKEVQSLLTRDICNADKTPFLSMAGSTLN